MSDVQVFVAGAAAQAAEAHVSTLVTDKVASRLFAQDHTLWGPDAESESAKRLSWVSLGESSRPLVEPIESLRKSLQDKGVDHVVLCGMGGSSLAPEVICATAGVPITVLDSSQPDMVRAALEDRLEQTVVVVSSKSGSTVETDSQRRAYVAAFEKAGIDPTERVVVVTDPGSPLDKEAHEAGFTVFNADPNVGGRYSALTAFGLVPSGLAGADIGALLDEAAAAQAILSADEADNPALRLGAALGGTTPLRDKVLLIDEGTPNKGFGDWAEQLIAESTGKLGKGLLPVVVDDAPQGELLADELSVHLVATASAAPSGVADVAVSGSLGGQMLLWEAAVAVAGRLIGINPFDQPDVESAKQAARDLMGQSNTAGDEANFTEGAVEVRANGDWLGAADSVSGALAALLAQVPQDGYLAVMAYLDRVADRSLADVRGLFARKLNRPVTFGWGPRFLHSTGQYHKGGPAIGVYLQITIEPTQDLAVPGRDFTFGSFISAQAAGDAKVLADKGRPVLRLHLTDGEAGMGELVQAIRTATSAS
ncbi:glucose-6-phosphate isomerase [Calidifontibacter terrae]